MEPQELVVLVVQAEQTVHQEQVVRQEHRVLQVHQELQVQVELAVQMVVQVHRVLQELVEHQVKTVFLRDKYTISTKVKIVMYQDIKLRQQNHQRQQHKQ
jgi:hypothetical protein